MYKEHILSFGTIYWNRSIRKAESNRGKQVFWKHRIREEKEIRGKRNSWECLWSRKKFQIQKKVPSPLVTLGRWQKQERKEKADCANEVPALPKEIKEAALLHSWALSFDVSLRNFRCCAKNDPEIIQKPQKILQVSNNLDHANKVNSMQAHIFENSQLNSCCGDNGHTTETEWVPGDEKRSNLYRFYKKEKYLSGLAKLFNQT